MFALLVVWCGVIGLCVGSFLNVVIYRVPLKKSIVKPGSFCPGCGSAVRPWDNIPIVSWFVLRGRCRSCGTRISVRYVVVEAATGLLFVVTAIRFGASWSLPAELAFVAGSVALATVDLERYLLPRAILYPTLALVAVALLAASLAQHHWSRLGVAAICMGGAFAAFFVLQLAKPAWLGFGDVRLAALLGLALGWLGPWFLLIGFLAANLLGSVIGLTLIGLGRATRTTRLPYGVFLTSGAFFALLVGAPIITAYQHLLTR